MMKDEDQFGNKISTYLDRSAASIKPGTAYRLQLARQEALARLGDPVRIGELQLAGAHAHGGSGNGPTGRGFRLTTRIWLGVLLIVVAGLAFKQWQDYQYQQLRDLEETDAAILSSDLPIDAYVDRGFQNWLKRAVDD